jgi:heme/copper-type cytochrome/quinol oxidase subunit 2
VDRSREPGLYLGNCAEYCGTEHANMLLRVVVHPVDEFQQWAAAQQKPAAGAIIWVPGSIVYLVPAVAIAARLFSGSGR